MNFGYAREGADVLRVDFDGGAQFPNVLGVDFDVGTQFAYVVGKDLEAFGQSFVAFREPIKSFIDGRACFDCSVSGIAAPNDGVRGTSRLNTCDLSGHIWVGTR